MDIDFPIFPLSVCILPGEKMNLHIFEPRYKQLINKSINDKINFVINFSEKNKIKPFGTSVKVDSLEKLYENGAMDISILGLEAFEMEKIQAPSNQDLFHTATFKAVEINYITENIEILSNFYSLFPSSNLIKSDDNNILSQSNIYSMANFLNLSQQEKYELLSHKNLEKKEKYFLYLLQYYSKIKKMEVETGNKFLLN